MRARRQAFILRTFSQIFRMSSVARTKFVFLLNNSIWSITHGGYTGWIWQASFLHCFHYLQCMEYTDNKKWLCKILPMLHAMASHTTKTMHQKYANRGFRLSYVPQGSPFIFINYHFLYGNYKKFLPIRAWIRTRYSTGYLMKSIFWGLQWRHGRCFSSCEWVDTVRQ